MAEKEEKLLMELQMEELREMYGIKPEESDVNNPRPNNARSEANAKIAKLYEACAEYEAELERFEAELEIILANDSKELVNALNQAFPDEEVDHAVELKAVVEAGWAALLENNENYTQAQLKLVAETPFPGLAEKLASESLDADVDFESVIKDILVKRWEMLIAIKKEHIEEEREDIEEYRGLKPDFAKGVYEKYHGIK